MFLSQEEWHSSILWMVLYLFWRGNLQLSIIWVALREAICLFPKNVGSSYAFFKSYYKDFFRIVAAIHSFKGTVNFSDVKICNHQILPMNFLSAHFRTQVNLKQMSYRSSYIFREASTILKWEQLLFCRFFSDHLVVWSSYFFLITTSTMCFSKAGTSSKQLFFQKIFFGRRYFLKTVSFFERLVLRDLLHSTYV